jgi:hypothetical protein
MKPISRVPALVLETNHKRDQVNAERQNPKQRDDADVLADLVRRGQEQD